MEAKIGLFEELAKCMRPVAHEETKVLSNPFIRMGIHEFLIDKSYHFFDTETFTFYYINPYTNMKFEFVPVNDEVKVYGWYDGDDDHIPEWALCWRFTNPGTLDGFKRILKAYLFTL